MVRGTMGDGYSQRPREPSSSSTRRRHLHLHRRCHHHPSFHRSSHHHPCRHGRRHHSLRSHPQRLQASTPCRCSTFLARWSHACSARVLALSVSSATSSPRRSKAPSSSLPSRRLRSLKKANLSRHQRYQDGLYKIVFPVCLTSWWCRRRVRSRALRRRHSRHPRPRSCVSSYPRASRSAGPIWS